MRFKIKTLKPLDYVKYKNLNDNIVIIFNLKINL